MKKQNIDLDNRITKFYQYLEHRLKLENEIEEKILLDETSLSIKINHIKDKKQPICSSI